MGIENKTIKNSDGPVCAYIILLCPYPELYTKNRRVWVDWIIPAVDIFGKKFRSAEFSRILGGGRGVVRLLWPRRVPKYVIFRILEKSVQP